MVGVIDEILLPASRSIAFADMTILGPLLGNRRYLRQISRNRDALKFRIGDRAKFIPRHIRFVKGGALGVKTLDVAISFYNRKI